MSLNINFAATFLPERTYLSKLLMFFNKNTSRDVFLESRQIKNVWNTICFEISDLTGIPNGKSTGKVIPHINYLVGMGLLRKTNDWYELTDFGKILIEEDISFSEPLSMIVAHSMLCDKKEGAESYSVIFEKLSSLNSISRMTLMEGLHINSRILAPIIGTYVDDAAFSKLRLIYEKEDKLCISPISLFNREWLPGFGALVIHLLNTYFKSKVQVAINDFETETSFSTRLGYCSGETWELYERLASAGYLRVSALVDPPVIEAAIDEKTAWKRLYDELI